MPTCSTDSRSIPAFAFIRVAQSYPLNVGKPASQKSLTVATAVVRNTFDGMRVAAFKGGDERDSVRRE